MNVLKIFGALVLFTGLVGACSSGKVPDAPSPIEEVGSQAQALTTACTSLTIGLPCDPDGPVGALLECEGICGVSKSGGDPICYKISALSLKNMDGRICGTKTAVGDAACARRCSGRSCLASAAPAGQACRPDAASSPCDGACDGSAHCVAIASACAFGRDEQTCKFKTCDFANATACVTQNLLPYTNCSNDSACQLGVCSSGGVCQPSNVKGCEDGNSCTDDDCDPNSGACIGTPNDANSCSDGNACTTGESCTGGTCLAGTVAVDCADASACTTDGCDPGTGCYHQQKDCSDANACTTDSCNPLDAACSHTKIDCDDNDPCTVDDCAPLTGCTHVQKDCSDGSACTTDTCVAGACAHNAVTCNDNDVCTTDSCDPGTGCLATAIADCGGGAAGAPSVGGASSDGGADTGGTTGTAGAPEGGSPSETAGAPATNGGDAPVGTGGQAVAGTAGTAGTPGAVSGSSTGGTPSVAGTEGSGDAGGNGGQNEGGSSGNRVVDDSGCSCRTVGAESGRASGLYLLAGAAALVSLRRRRRAA